MLFKRYENNPVLSPNTENDFESVNTYNACSIVHKGKIYIIYRAEDANYLSKLCMASSKDGYNFVRYKNNPIIEPTLPEEKGGCEDPRIIKIGDTYYMTYTSYTGEHPVTPETINTSLATSKDMENWKKHGIIVKGLKSSVILSEKINGKYLMIVGGENIRLAWSDDLFNWKVEEEPILETRKGMFDSRFVETGPNPLIMEDIIVLFFNTADDKGAFNPSIVILDKKDPSKVLYRANEPFMKPRENYETKGKVKNVIFIEGLLEFQGKYFLYYGAADRYVAVATVEKENLKKYISKLVKGI